MPLPTHCSIITGMDVHRASQPYRLNIVHAPKSICRVSPDCHCLMTSNKPQLWWMWGLLVLAVLFSPVTAPSQGGNLLAGTTLVWFWFSFLGSSVRFPSNRSVWGLTGGGIAVSPSWLPFNYFNGSKALWICTPIFRQIILKPIWACSPISSYVIWTTF